MAGDPAGAGERVWMGVQNPSRTNLPLPHLPTLPPLSRQVSPQNRCHAKAVAYGLIYGKGAVALSKELGCAVAEAERIAAEFKASIPGAMSWIAGVINSCHHKG